MLQNVSMVRLERKGANPEAGFWHFAGTVILLIAICPWNKVHIDGVYIPDERSEKP